MILFTVVKILFDIQMTYYTIVMRTFDILLLLQKQCALFCLNVKVVNYYHI